MQLKGGTRLLDTAMIELILYGIFISTFCCQILNQKIC